VSSRTDACSLKIAGGLVKSAYRIVARLIALGDVLQVTSIALGAFMPAHAVDACDAIDDQYTSFGCGFRHIMGMPIIPLITLVLLVVSFFAHLPGGVRWAAIIFGLVVLQVALAYISFAAPVVGVLHGINALAILIISGRTGQLGSETAPSAAGAAAV